MEAALLQLTLQMCMKVFIGALCAHFEAVVLKL